MSADSRERWSTAHAQLWTGIAAPAVPEHPLRTPPRIPHEAREETPPPQLPPPAGAATIATTTATPPRDSVNLSALTVNADASVMSVAPPGFGVDKEAIIIELRGQLRLARRELAAERNQRARDASALAALAREIHQSLVRDTAADVGAALSCLPAQGRDPESAAALDDLVAAINALGRRVRALQKRDHAGESAADTNDSGGAFDAGADVAGAELRAWVLRLVAVVSADLEVRVHADAPVLHVLEEVEARIVASSQLLQEVLCRSCGVASTDVPLTLQGRAEKVFACGVVALHPSSASPRKQQKRRGAPAAASVATSPSAAAERDVACVAELRRVVDLLGGDGDAAAGGELAQCASSLALRAARGREQALRDASIAELALAEYERRVRPLLERLGVSRAPSAQGLREQLARCAAGDTPPGAAATAMEGELVAECGWVQALTQSGARLLAELGAALGSSSEEEEGTEALQPNRAAHVRVFRALMQRAADHRSATARLQSLAATAIDAGERIAGIPPSTSRPEAASIAELECRVAGLRSVEDDVALALREVAPLLPRGHAGGERGMSVAGALGHLRLILTGEGAATAIATATATATAAVTRDTEGEGGRLARLTAKIDREVMVMGSPGCCWAGLLAAVLPDADAALFAPAHSATLEDAVDAAAARSLRMSQLLRDKVASGDAAACAPHAMQKHSLQLARLVSAAGGILPPGASAASLDDLVQLLDIRVTELQKALQKAQRAETAHRSERSKLEQLIAGAGGAIVATLRGVQGGSEEAKRKGGAAAAAAVPTDAPRTFAEFFEPTLNAASALATEASQRIEKMTQTLKNDQVRVDNYAETHQALQKRLKRADGEVSKICMLLGIDAAAEQAGKAQDLCQKLAVIAERLIVTAPPSGAAAATATPTSSTAPATATATATTAGADQPTPRPEAPNGATERDAGAHVADAANLAEELRALKEEMVEKDATMHEAMAIVLQNFAIVARGLKASLMCFSAAESEPDEMVVAASEDAEQFNDDEVEDLLRHAMGCARRYTKRIEEFTAEHLHTMQKVVTYHQAMHATLTRAHSEKHDATINDINECLLRYADDVLLALNSRGQAPDCAEEPAAPAAAAPCTDAAPEAADDGAPGPPASPPPPPPPPPSALLPPGADHRLVRILDSLHSLHNAVAGVAQVRYLQIPDEVANLDAGDYVDLATATAAASASSDPPALSSDQLMRLAERNIAAIVRRVGAFSASFKSAAIIVEKDIDFIQRELDGAICRLSQFPLERYFKIDRAQLEELHAILSDKAAQRGSYFFNRAGGAGVCPWSLATRHVCSALYSMGDVAVERATHAKHFKAIVEKAADVCVEFLAWHRTRRARQRAGGGDAGEHRSGGDGAAADRGIDGLDEVVDEDVPALMAHMLRELQANGDATALEEEVTQLTEALQLARESAAVAQSRGAAEAQQAAETIAALRSELDTAQSDAALARAKLKRVIAAAQRARATSSRAETPLSRDGAQDVRTTPAAYSAAPPRAPTPSPTTRRARSDLASSLPAEYGQAIADEIRQRRLCSPERVEERRPRSAGRRAPAAPTPVSRALSLERMSSRASTLMTPTAASALKQHTASAPAPSASARRRGSGSGTRSATPPSRPPPAGSARAAMSTANAAPFDPRNEGVERASRWVGFTSPSRATQRPAWSGVRGDGGACSDAGPLSVPRHSVVVVQVPRDSSKFVPVVATSAGSVAAASKDGEAPEESARTRRRQHQAGSSGGGNKGARGAPTGARW